MRIPMRLPVLRDAYSAHYAMQFALPLPLAEFVSQLQAKGVDSYREEMRKLLARNEAEVFPRGRSAKLLAEIERAYCPMLVMQSENRTWEVDGSGAMNAELPDDGSICTRDGAEFTLFNISRGESVPDAAFYADSRVSMDC